MRNVDEHVAADGIWLLIAFVLSATGVVFPQDTSPMDKKLNIAELNGAQTPFLTFTASVGTDTQATIGSIVVKDHTTGATYTSGAAGDVTYAGNVVTVKLDQGITTTEQNYDFDLIITDSAGNSRRPSPSRASVIDNVRTDLLFWSSRERPARC